MHEIGNKPKPREDAHTSFPTPLESATALFDRGFCVIPVPHRSKDPGRTRWQKERIGREELPKRFNCAPMNIGILTGEPSGWIVDVDLDHPKAVELAPLFLPATGAIFGREGKPRSHYLFRLTGPLNTQKFKHKPHGMIAELRSTGCQTVAPGSVHESGEQIRWYADGIPATVDADVLIAAIKALFDAVVKALGGEPAKAAAPKPAPALAARAGSTTPYGRKAMEGEAAAVAAAMEGSRNETLYESSLKLGSLIGAGELDETEARQALEAAARTCGLPDDEALPTIKSGIENGKANPRVRASERPASSARYDHGPPDDEDGVTDGPTDGIFDPGPLPASYLNVPGFLGEVIEHNRETAHRWQPQLALAGAIALQAVLAARKVRDERGNRTNLYIVGLASSGSGKDNARSVNKAVLQAAGFPDLEGQEDLASDAGLLAAVMEQPAVLFQIDEFGRWLRSIADPRKAPHLFNVVSVMLKLYSSARGVFKGKAYADPTKNRSVDQPCVSLFATTAPDHFRQCLTPEAMSDGFMARLLVFEADDMPPRSWRPERDVPQGIIEAARWWGEYSPCPAWSQSAQTLRPKVIATTPGGRSVFDALAARADAEMRDKGEEVRSIWARAEEKACRLALVYACSRDRQKPVVDDEAARWACGLSEHLTRRMLWQGHQYSTRSDFDAKQKAVLRAIRKAGGSMTKSAMCRATQHLTVRERDEVIDNLVQTGRLRTVDVVTKGRPRRDYELRE